MCMYACIYIYISFLQDQPCNELHGQSKANLEGFMDMGRKKRGFN